MSYKQLGLLVVSTIMLVAVVVGIAFATRGGSGSAATCGKRGVSHAVVIQNDRLNSPAITAKRCDSLTITNLDNTVREVGFGPHDHHQPYDGIAEKVLRRNQSLTVTLEQTGTFHYHDHFHDEVAGSFTVTP